MKLWCFNNQLNGYVHWLASRYTRPALPTTFNNRIARSDSKNKRKKIAKSLDAGLSGIYVEISPNKELPENEDYSVNLLGLIAAGYTDDRGDIENKIEKYAEFMRSANMDVLVSVRSEDEISVAVFNRFQRFYYDDLSLRNKSSLPIEASGNI